MFAFRRLALWTARMHLKLLRAGRPELITERARQFLKVVRDARRD
jgi:hypothetical protein